MKERKKRYRTSDPIRLRKVPVTEHYYFALMGVYTDPPQEIKRTDRKMVVRPSRHHQSNRDVTPEVVCTKDHDIQASFQSWASGPRCLADLWRSIVQQLAASPAPSLRRSHPPTAQSPTCLRASLFATDAEDGCSPARPRCTENLSGWVRVLDGDWVATDFRSVADRHSFVSGCAGSRSRDLRRYRSADIRALSAEDLQ